MPIIGQTGNNKNVFKHNLDPKEVEGTNGQSVPNLVDNQYETPNMFVPRDIDQEGT